MPLHVQNVHLLPQYISNNDVEQSDIPSGLLLMEYNLWQVQSNLSFPPAVHNVFGLTSKTSRIKVGNLQFSLPLQLLQ